MIEKICAFIHNYFVYSRYSGTFTIENGGIELPFLTSGQYFRLCGSRLNDGVYQYPASELADETFDGVIWEMRVPRRLLALAAEIEEWDAKYRSAMSSPFQSESFKGYSYTLKSGGSDGGSGGADAQAWQKAFAGQLNEWRKLS